MWTPNPSPHYSMSEYVATTVHKVVGRGKGRDMVVSQLQKYDSGQEKEEMLLSSETLCCMLLESYGVMCSSYSTPGTQSTSLIPHVPEVQCLERPVDTQALCDGDCSFISNLTPSSTQVV